MSQIEARPKSIFSWGFHLHTRQGRFATMDMAWIKEGGSFDWQGTSYSLRRENWLAGDFLLQTGNETIARAIKESAFLRRFLVRIGSRELVLEAASPFTRQFRLMEHSRTLGRIAPHHPLTRSTTIELPDDLHVPEQVFLFWLVALMWRRSSNSAAASM